MNRPATAPAGAGHNVSEQSLEIIQLRCTKELADGIHTVSRATGVTPDDVASVLAWLALRPMLAAHIEPVEDVEL